MASTNATRVSLGSLWQRAARLYRRVEATERGYVWLNMLGPAYLFGLVGVVKAWALSGTIGPALVDSGDPRPILLAGHQALGVVFFGLVAALYLLRRRPLRRVANPLQGLIALLGSYVMLPVAVGGASTGSAGVLLLADVLMVIGTGGAALALASLGRCFGIFPEARGLVTHGAYRFVRHPMYLFEFIAFLGILLPSLTGLNAALYAVFVGCQLARMRYEEATLSAVFPLEYAAYARRTPRLLPGLY